MISRLAPDHLKCRTWRHAWEEFVPHGMKPPSWGVRISLRCIRCGCERHDVIDRLGELSTRNYDYPDGYSLTRDETPDVQHLRLMLVKQLHIGSGNGNGKRRSNGGNGSKLKAV